MNGIERQYRKLVYCMFDNILIRFFEEEFNKDNVIISHAYRKCSSNTAFEVTLFGSKNNTIHLEIRYRVKELVFLPEYSLRCDFVNTKRNVRTSYSDLKDKFNTLVKSFFVIIENDIHSTDVSCSIDVVEQR